MLHVKFSTPRGHILIHSEDIIFQGQQYIQLVPGGNYNLEINPDKGIYCDINTKGSLNDTQHISVGFIFIDDPTYCSPYLSVNIGYENPKPIDILLDQYK